MNTSIEVRQVGKRYRKYKRRIDLLLQLFLPKVNAPSTETWILKDISFDIHQGDAVAIVGMNGAGKSTLLKMITGTTTPTVGSISIHGKVAAILELGMGFHSDFTGRQNALMGLELLGLSSAQAAQLLPAVQSFAEIGNYFDRPLRIYSSGMQIRLAFAVATAVRPDVLIVDEALSVGDTYFQHKSFAKIRDFNRQGTTLLMVSHDKGAIQSICNRAILIHGGVIYRQGRPDEIMDVYNALIAEKENDPTLEMDRQLVDRAITQSGNGKAEVLKAELLCAHSRKPLNLLEVGQPVILSLRIQIHQALEKLVIGYCIRDRLGQDVFGTNTQLLDQALYKLAANSFVDAEFEFESGLGVGSYSISTALTNQKHHLEESYFWRDLHLIFEVVNPNKPEFVGCNWMPPTRIKIEKA